MPMAVHLPLLSLLLSLMCLSSGWPLFFAYTASLQSLCLDFGQTAVQVLSSLHTAYRQSRCVKCVSQLAHHVLIGLFSMHSLNHCIKGMRQNLCVDVNL